MTLDQRINSEIYELITKGKISSAKILCSVIKSDSDSPSLSFQGLPSYYFGKRDAETVMVNLNPGESVDKNIKGWTGDLKEPRSLNRKQLSENPSKEEISEFVCKYHDFQQKFAEQEGYNTDSFDVKQAAFLTPWENNGIEELPKNPNWSDTTIQGKAARSVVSNKLQLELLPYASAKFDINKKGNIKLLFPYIEMLLDQIFSKKRTYGKALCA